LTPEQGTLCDRFASGLAAYRRQAWDEPHAHFESCLSTKLDDGPTRLFLERIALLRETPPPADWNGMWHPLEKGTDSGAAARSLPRPAAVRHLTVQS
jgi:adenylate cyclase